MAWASGLDSGSVPALRSGQSRRSSSEEMVTEPGLSTSPGDRASLRQELEEAILRRVSSCGAAAGGVPGLHLVAVEQFLDRTATSPVCVEQEGALPLRRMLVGHRVVWQWAGLRVQVSDCTTAGPFHLLFVFFCLALSVHVVSTAYLRHLVWSLLQQVVGTGQTHLMIRLAQGTLSVHMAE